MLFQLKKKFWAWGDDYEIKDEAGEVRYLVDGKVFTIGDQLKILNPDGSIAGSIEEQMLTWKSTHRITYGRSEIAVITKRIFTFLNCVYDIEVHGETPLVVEGNFLETEYAFRRGDQQIASVSQRFFSLHDRYGVEIYESTAEFLVLASTIVIDLVCRKEHSD